MADGLPPYRLRTLFLLVAVCALVVALPLWALRASRNAAAESACAGNLSAIGVGLLSYQDMYGALPPAYIAGEDGRRMHSWRILILPFVGFDDVYRAYDFGEPWNGPNNRKLLHRVPSVYRCRNAAADGGRTSYFVVVGNATAFPFDKGTSLSDASDGVENTILVVESATADVQWLEPTDLVFDEMNFLINDRRAVGVSSADANGPGALFADARYFRLKRALPAEALRALLTPAGGEPIDRERLVDMKLVQ